MVKQYSLSDMIGGWFVGNFDPTVIHTDAFEVAVKYYQQGDSESAHHHKIADELTVIASGKVRMAGQVYSKGDIVHIGVNESTDFHALEDTITVVVKRPSVADDKYID